MQHDIELKISEVKQLLYYCTDVQTKREVQEDLLFLNRYVPNPSIEFLEGLKNRLLKTRKS